MNIDPNVEQNFQKPISKNTELIIQFGFGLVSSIIIFVLSLLYDKYPDFLNENMVYIIFMFALGIFNFIIPKKRGFYDKYQKALLYERKTLTQKIIRLTKKDGAKKMGEASGDLSIFLVSLLPSIIPNLTPSVLASYVVLILSTIEANIIIIMPFFIAFISMLVGFVNSILYQIKKIL
tara:strand:+ start:52 stop:585 length:534 start_codon:yes stop_codon:yes gene_type:complete